MKKIKDNVTTYPSHEDAEFAEKELQQFLTSCLTSLSQKDLSLQGRTKKETNESQHGSPDFYSVNIKEYY